MRDLGAEKFLLDGRHVGTGEAAATSFLSAATPIGQPGFCAVPTCCGASIGYWCRIIRHSPICFSGMFLGPT